MAGPNMDQYEAFFRKADLDGDGRISGAEAVAFLQGSGLSKPVLAQIWMHADQSKTGFLSRAEFYNALKLVTVAQSKRELTPEIVKAALFGAASAKIPAPQITLSSLPAPRPNVMPPAPTPQSQGVAQANINQNYFSAQQNLPVRPPQPALPAGGAVALNVVNSSGIANSWLGGGPRAMGPSGPRPQMPVSSPPQATNIVSVSKALVVSGNGVPSNSSFGGDMFSLSATPTLTRTSSGGPQLSNNTSSINVLSDGFSMQPKIGQFQQPQAPLNPSQLAPAPVSSAFVSSGISVGMGTSAQSSSAFVSSGISVGMGTSTPPSSSAFVSSGISVGMGNSTPGNSQPSWPKMKPTDVQKYTKVFLEVDTDRDGKITGEQARNLFLSWRLPREVLKQVWDLSDQDNDSMLSLREFCFALYLMERSREGRPLPPALPNNVLYDETLLSMTGQPRGNYGNAAWNPSQGTGFAQQPGMPSAQPVAPNVNLRPPMPTSGLKRDIAQSNQQNFSAPVLNDAFLDQRDNGHQNSAFSKSQEQGGQKVEEAKNAILDSREKIELYRTKMQELVLYKSRCDNKLNEITERASADKREADTLGKRYEERYKQVGELASKLTIEEASFRDVQERKMELNQAIIKMEQGGSADGILQVRADRIQNDLEELMKALNERCKKHGLQIKSCAIIDLPKGWQPGIQEGAAVWDEEWDKFEDEGFLNDLTIDVKNSSHPPPREMASPDGALESESVFSHNEDEYERSPNGRTASGSPSQAFSEVNYGKDSEADAETHRSFDEPWSAFDYNDDVDSVWGFNTQKTNDVDKHRDSFGSDSFSVNPVRTGSPQKKSHFAFDDSVPSTPLSRFGSNSPRYSEAGDHYYDNNTFSRFDSFAGQPESLTRFDSINSSKDFGRFDSMSSSRDFGGPAPFSRFDQSSREFGHNPEKLTRFDSINSTRDFGYDEADPFGSSGPFKVSSESQTTKKGSDNWSAF